MNDVRTWWCRSALRGLAASFAIVGALFLVMPDGTIRLMNFLGERLGDFTPAPPSALRFWLSLATGYMALVTALAYVAQRDPARHRDLIALLALGKGVTSLTSLAFYVTTMHAFVYAANFVVDGVIAVAAVAIWAAAPSLGAPGGGEPLPRGTDRESSRAAAIDALVDAMIPSGGAFAEGARSLAVADDVRRFVGGIGPLAGRALDLGVRAFDVAPFFVPPLRLRRFSRLPLDERIRVLEAWERSRLVLRRQAMHALKVVVMAQFYSRPDVHARLGYPHPLDRVPRPEPAP